MLPQRKDAAVSQMQFVKAAPIASDRSRVAATRVRPNQPDGVRRELQARLAGRYAIDSTSLCYGR
jgi:hypothetical protein